MDPVTMRHKQGKLRFRDETITIERVGFPRPAPREVPFSQIGAIHQQVTFPSLFGQGGAMNITLRLLDAPAEDLEIVTPLASAQRMVAAVEAYLVSNPPAAEAAAPAIAATGVAGTQEQMVKVYRGGDCAKQFERDFKKLAAQGWRVLSQSYGGQTSKAGAVLLFGVFGLAAGTKPREMTVIYIRG